jgi:uncharacterized protein (TIGR02246 family)
VVFSTDVWYRVWQKLVSDTTMHRQLGGAPPGRLAAGIMVRMIAGTEANLQEIVARAGCMDAIEEFYRAVDEGQAMRAAVLFTEDAVLDTDKVYVGKEQIMSFLQARETRPGKSLHVVSGPNVRVLSEDELEIDAVVQLYVRSEDGSPKFQRAGVYTHRCVRQDHRWLLAARTGRPHPISVD